MNTKLIIIGCAIVLLPPLCASLTVALIPFTIGLMLIGVGVFWNQQ